MAVILNTKGTTETEFRLGRDGATIKTGSGVPGALAGNLGDVYLDYTNGTMYINGSGGWTLVTTIATNNNQTLSNLTGSLQYRHSSTTSRQLGEVGFGSGDVPWSDRQHHVYRRND
jgi:hypothetical protein